MNEFENEFWRETKDNVHPTGNVIAYYARTDEYYILFYDFKDKEWYRPHYATPSPVPDYWIHLPNKPAIKTKLEILSHNALYNWHNWHYRFLLENKTRSYRPTRDTKKPK